MKVCYFHLVSNLIQLKINGSPWLSGHPDIQNSTALNLVSSVLKPSTEQQGWRQPQAKALNLLGTENRPQSNNGASFSVAFTTQSSIEMYYPAGPCGREAWQKPSKNGGNFKESTWRLVGDLCKVCHCTHACKYSHKPTSMHTYT